MHGPYGPAGAIVPTNPSLGPNGYRGIYLAKASEMSCCWIAPHAEILVKKPPHTSTLVAGFVMPDLPEFARGQSLTVTIDGKPVDTERLQDGQHLYRMHLPAELAAMHGTLPIRIDASTDYVPAKAGVSTDSRHLAAVLMYLYFV
ncbi:MAG TPA: hypothetical protein VF741_01635 [Candidatus Aquilonibacter sp.]|jgi:hypothetical protein